MGTIARFDVTRTELTELHYSRQRNAAEIGNGGTGWRNRLYLWPHTQTLTLQPINLTPDFVRSGNWESLKFRLADVVYDPDWWVEQPNISGDDKRKTDYFFQVKATNKNLPSGFPTGGGFSVIANLVAITQIAVLDAALYQEANTVPAMYSKADLPANQGYVLRWHQEGRPEFADNLFSFHFGDFALQVVGDGKAYLYQAADDTLQTYGQIYEFPWALDTQIHDRFHQITIYPHARNKIEFLTRTSASYGIASLWEWGRRGTNGGGVYTLPGTAQPDATGSFPITKAGPWYLSISKRFRPFIQVSRLAFVDGDDGQAYLYDDADDLSYAPFMPVQFMPEADLNGGTVSSFLLDPTTGNPFASDGTKSVLQYAAAFAGVKDLADKGGNASTYSPEFYGYSLYKPPGLTKYVRTPVEFPVQSIKIDKGATPEEERLTITVKNSNGQADSYARRATIPLELVDDATGIVYFEGEAISVVSGEAPTNAQRTLTVEAVGMVDNLLRHEWATMFVFSKDPDDVAGRGYIWTQALRRCLNACGVPDEEIVIEDEAKYPVRLWTDGDGGGTRSDSGVGDGHSAAQTLGDRWSTALTNPCYPFIDYLVRDVFGWNWYRDNQNRVWRVYKRPIPYQPADAGKFVPKAVFYGNPKARRADTTGLPTYEHAHFQTETTRPVCTTVLMEAMLSESQFLSRAELAAMLAKEKAGQTDPESRAIETKPRRVPLPMTNPYGVDGPPDHPDYMGRLRLKRFFDGRIASRDALEWWGRRTYDDYVHGACFATFVGDWGDAVTAPLRKWDVILADSGRDENDHSDGSLEAWLIDRIEPVWSHDTIRKARYRCSLYRPDAPPPR